MKRIALFTVLGAAAAGCALICAKILRDKGKEDCSEDECRSDCSCAGYAECDYPDVTDVAEGDTEAKTEQETTEDESAKPVEAEAAEACTCEKCESAQAAQVPASDPSFFEEQAKLEVELQAELDAELERKNKKAADAENPQS